MEEPEYENAIQWFGLQCYYNEMLHYAEEATESYPASENFKLLHALALSLTGQAREASKEIPALIGDVDHSLPALVIQKFVHKTTASTNRMLIDETEARIKESRRKASPLALALASMILLLLKKPGKAQDYADKAYKLDPSNQKIRLVKGWCELHSKTKKAEKTIDYFASVLQEDGKNFGAVLGSAKFKRCQGEHSAAVSTLNALIVRYPHLSIPLVEKMGNQLALKDWDLVLETATRISAIESHNLESLKAKVTISICRDGDFVEGVQYLKQLFKNMSHNEPKNMDLAISVVRLFSRMTNENQGLLSELLKTTEKMAQQNKSGNPGLLVEHGNLCLKVGNAKEAENWYRSTIQIDESSFPALIGLAQCQLLEPSPEAAELAQQQVDLLMEIQQSGSSVAPEIFFMSAQLSKKKDSNKALGYLEMAAKTVLQDCENVPYGYEHLSRLNPDFCMKIASEYLQHLPGYHFLERRDQATEKTRNTDNACTRVLEFTTEACPGFGNALLTLARIKMQLGDLEGAKTSLKKLLGVDSTNAAGYLLMAQIAARQGQYHLVSQTLEVGVSYNFEVRDDPMYHTLSGILAKENGDYESCIEHMKTAMSRSKRGIDSEGISTSEKATLYLELISAYGKLRKFDDALGMMEEAKNELENTIEEGRVVIGDAELALEMGDVDRAIRLLSEVTADAPHYLQAHKKLADVYLKQKKDRQKFAQCYKELVKDYPDPETYIMLGDAYVAIQEPEMAIEAYEYALRNNSKDGASSRKMGKALIKTHQYKKAVEYYKDAIKYANSEELKLDLAELYMKMKQYENAESVLLQNMKISSLDRAAMENSSSVEIWAKQLQLLAKIREKSGKIQAALETSKEAKEVLVKQSRRRLSTSLTSLEHKQIITRLCLETAEYASTMRNYEDAVQYFKEALNYTPSDVSIMLSMAKLYLQMNDLESCAQSCSAVLNEDPNNEAASVMMADIAFRRVDFESAAYHFRQILLQRPTYWTALARLVEVSRRMSNMDELEDWMVRAKEAVQTSKDEAGYHYCAGLLDWRLGKLNTALRHFNAARRDPEWGQQAVYNMIEICLDQDDDAMTSSEVFSDEDAEYQDTRSIAMKTVQRLLQELNPKGNAQEILTRRLLGNFFLLGTKQKSNIEKALQDCTNLASQEALKDHVGPALGLAMAHMLLKQTPRARNHLKRVSKNTWTFEDAEYLERCWLLLANIYVQSSKYDIAHELLKRVLQYNASCVKAHELMAQIAEKEQNYNEAIAHYSHAWKFGGRSKLSVGYKLSYCYFKSKSYANAIDISYEVLKINADYPRIRKDILEKSINNLRT